MNMILDLIYGATMLGLFVFITYISVIAYRSREYRDAVLLELCALLCLLLSHSALKGLLP